MWLAAPFWTEHSLSFWLLGAVPGWLPGGAEVTTEGLRMTRLRGLSHAHTWEIRLSHSLNPPPTGKSWQCPPFSTASGHQRQVCGCRLLHDPRGRGVHWVELYRQRTHTHTKSKVPTWLQCPH